MKLSSPNFNFVSALLLSSSLVLTACGGGGGGDSNPAPVAASSVSSSASSSSVSSATATLVANPGTDLTVNAGATISLDPHAVVVNPTVFTSGSGNLEVRGSSTVATDIVSVKWTKVSGPAFALTTTDTTSGKGSFVAPGTGTAATLTVVYKLTITNAAGAIGEANVTFTINRVNQVPTVTATTSTPTVKGKTAVVVQSTAADSDGTIASYTWTQVSGPAVTLQNASTSTLNFEAPSTTTKQDVVVKVEVADNDGVKASTQVTVSVTPENAPTVNVLFPRNGIYTEATISAVGSVTTLNGATLTSVMVDIGSGAIAATLTGNGWRLDGLTVPAADTPFSLAITATDSAGIQGVSNIALVKTGSTVGTGGQWSGTEDIVYDPSGKLFVLTNGVLVSSFRLFSIDLSTGNRSADISNFGVSSQGIAPTAIKKIFGVPAQQKIYVTSSPSSSTPPKQVFTIDTVSGQRTLVSDPSLGTGTAFSNPVGMAIKGQTLYVADNAAHAIVAVDTATGNRTVVANASTVTSGIGAPLDLAYDGAKNVLYVAPNAATMFLQKLDLSVSPVTSSVLTNVGSSGPGTGASITAPTQALFLNASKNQLLLVDGTSRLVGIDLTSGNRTALATLPITTGVALDEVNQLLYITTGTSPQELQLVDLASMHRVTISK